MQARPVHPVDERGELRGRQPHHAVADRRPAERALLEPLPEQHQAGPVPGQNLQPVRPLRAEDEDRPRERIAARAARAPARRGCRRRAGSPPASSPPAPALPAGTAIMSPPSRRAAPSSASRHRSQARTRTVAAPITISIIAALPGAAARNRRPRMPAERLHDHRRKGTLHSRRPALCRRLRASRRQPNNCCGVSPCRRATADTVSPLS